MTSNSLPIFPSPGAPQAAPRGVAVLRLGFRPFYWSAAVFAMLAVPAWAWMLAGGWAPAGPVPALWWHAHEMLFGFAVAVIVGFLLTAGKAWTGLATPRGAVLGALVLWWWAARVTAWTGPYALHAWVDVWFLPVVAGFLAQVLLHAGNRRNLPLVGILLLLSVLNGLYHAAIADLLPLSPLHALHGALGLVIVLATVIAGRIIPGFTMSATPGLRIVLRPALEGAVLVATPLALAAWAFAPSGAWVAGALGVAGALHIARQWQWRPWVTGDRPVLWILHAGYAWLPVGLLLLAAAQLGWVPGSAGVHALATGTIGGLIIGMITRTARGHTGRPLRVGRLEVAAYVLVMAAALLRVALPLAVPAWALAAMVAAAVAWSLAFVLYLWVYTPWLWSTRADSKDG